MILPQEKKKEMIVFLLNYKKAFTMLLQKNNTKEVQIKMVGFYFDQYIKNISNEEVQEETLGEMLNINKTGLEEFELDMLEILGIIKKPFEINGKQIKATLVFEKFLKEYEEKFFKDIEY